MLSAFSLAWQISKGHDKHGNNLVSLLEAMAVIARVEAAENAAEMRHRCLKGEDLLNKMVELCPTSEMCPSIALLSIGIRRWGSQRTKMYFCCRSTKATHRRDMSSTCRTIRNRTKGKFKIQSILDETHAVGGMSK